MLPTITPRLISRYQEPEDAEPFRIYSDAAGDGKLASIARSPQSSSSLPVLSEGSSGDELNALAASTNPIYIYELFAMVASVFQVREQLAGKRSILLLDNEAACAALTAGTSKVPGALLVVYALRATAAEHDVGLWTERIPTGANPADLPSRDRELPFPTEPTKELASFSDIPATYDCSRALLQSEK